eukprot:TRINITY_DN13882_c0_g1_i1.p1 TRINITY_DN13882_c0_g1~~TRINITY_DN13882_c0_g1_i1.p1  ORF type:complete len:263 (+),score=39.42 TRINITY_DN13882_c0_g1_i1:72-860(+)
MKNHISSEELDAKLDELEREGFLLIPKALSTELTERLRLSINEAREKGLYCGVNKVGNMWFDKILEREPELYSQLIAHPSVAPFLRRLMGRQCQLRSIRAHTNPGRYVQEWHLDFYGYWEELKESKLSRYGVAPFCCNTTFYLQDNGPDLAYLEFVKQGHKKEPPYLNPYDREKFNSWCSEQNKVVIYPKAGDCVLFYSHIPHRGVKIKDDMERSNIVVNYQINPMWPTVWHVSWPYTNSLVETFPFKGPDKNTYPVKKTNM